MQQNSAEVLEEKFRAEEKVNGVTISCFWDEDYKDYVLFFPEIAFGDEKAAQEGVADQLFRIGDDEEKARRVYEYAKKMAERGNDKYEVYRAAEKYTHGIEGALYTADATVNGIRITCSYDDHYQNYVLRFPELSVGDDTYAAGIPDQAIVLSDQPADAQKVFEFARLTAETNADIFSVYKKAEQFARDARKNSL